MKVYTSTGWHCQCDTCGTDISWHAESRSNGMCVSCRCAFIGSALATLEAVEWARKQSTSRSFAGDEELQLPFGD